MRAPTRTENQLALFPNRLSAIRRGATWGARFWTRVDEHHVPDGFICSPFIHIKEMYSIAGGLALYYGPFQQPSCHLFHSCPDGLKRHVRAPTRMDYDNFYMNANIKNSNEYFVNHRLFSSYSHMPLIKSKKNSPGSILCYRTEKISDSLITTIVKMECISSRYAQNQQFTTFWTNKYRVTTLWSIMNLLKNIIPKELRDDFIIPRKFDYW